MKKDTIRTVIISYYTLLTDAIWNHFHPKNEEPFLAFARILRSRDENFTVEILRGFSNYNHSMAFSTCLNHTREGKRKHRALQMKYFKTALDFCWLAGVKIPKPPWRVLRVFPDLRLLTTKKGRLAYALGKRMNGNEAKSESLCGCEGSCPACCTGEVDNHKCDSCHVEFCPKCHGIVNGIKSENVSPCKCEKIPKKERFIRHAGWPLRPKESRSKGYRKKTLCGISVDKLFISTTIYTPSITCLRCLKSLGIKEEK